MTALRALTGYEGRPGDYQIERVNVLERELAEVEAKAKALTDVELPRLNETLKGKGLPPLARAEAEAAGRLAAALERLAAGRTERVVATQRHELD